MNFTCNRKLHCLGNWERGVYLGDGGKFTEPQIILRHMTKVERLKRDQEKQQERCGEFLNFIRNTEFIETIDKVGNFGLNLPFFYKKVSKNTFLAFNIPTFKNVKKYGFHADFWKIIAESEKDFLANRIENKNLIDLKLSFDLAEDIKIYETELSKY